jgi:hypothetical protein
VALLIDGASATVRAWSTKRAASQERRRSPGRRYGRDVGGALRRGARRQELVERLGAALGPVLGPRLSVEVSGSAGVAVLLDGGRGGTVLTRAAPWLPRPGSADLLATARGVVDAAHLAATRQWPGSSPLGPRTPSVERTDGAVRIRLFGPGGEALPVVEVRLDVP